MLTVFWINRKYYRAVIKEHGKFIWTDPYDIEPFDDYAWFVSFWVLNISSGTILLTIIGTYFP